METKLRVLLVDDNAMLRRTLRILLTSPSIEIISEAGDGCVAVELARHLVPDVVLMDYRMPLMNGIEAARLILAGPHPPIIVLLSGEIEPALCTAAQQAGISFVFQKGADFSAIHQALLHTMARKQVPLITAA